mmetsp:Transcript_144886/g.255392  ORF Transcript_144886/g.255392 Transcript_144886/m.255392 type:complete len:417 (+) Transcript_144886:99-1349(+)
MTSVVYAKAEDVKRLQLQVEQMKERLDFISPLLSSVNFVQDYTQRVECEAAVQMMRLKNAKVMRNIGSDSEDEPSNAQLETVKWLHFMTDAIMASTGMADQGAAAHSAPSMPPSMRDLPKVHRAPPRAEPLPFTGRDAGGSALGPLAADIQRRLGYAGAAELTPGPRSDSPHMLARRSPHTGDATPESLQADSSRLRAEVARLRVEADVEAFRNSDRGNYTSMQPSLREREQSGELHREGNREVSSRVNTPALTPTSSIGQAPAGILGGPFPSGYPPAAGRGTMPRGGGEEPAAEPLAEPGTGGTAGLMEMTGSGGLVMGKGSWATAYRQAQGARREALRLLCTTDIVTARELSDDLTVISEEHIEECVSIATEMLQTWTLDMWARQPQEAKKFFEARLTALYQRKFGEQNNVKTA